MNFDKITLSHWTESERDSIRVITRKPFMVDGRVFATDGTRFVTVPPNGHEYANLDDVTDRITAGNVRTMTQIAREASYSAAHHVPLPDATTCAACVGTGRRQAVDCTVCGGVGEDTFGRDCPRCAGDGYIYEPARGAECTECYGTGRAYNGATSLIYPLRIIVAGVGVNANYYRLVEKLPGVEFATNLMAGSKFSALFFRADGGIEGAIAERKA